MIESRTVVRLIVQESTLPLLAELLGDQDDWRSRGACVGADYRLFEPAADGERLRGYPARAIAAARYCRTCPVIEQCRRWAEARKEQGVWAAEWRTGLAGDNQAWPIHIDEPRRRAVLTAPST